MHTNLIKFLVKIRVFPNRFNMADEGEQEQEFNFGGEPDGDAFGDEGFVGENETSHDGETGEANAAAEDAEDDPVCISIVFHVAWQGVN
jgi:hypothetical protein